MKKIQFILIGFILFTNSIMAETFVAGTDYTVLDPTVAKQKTVSVIEFFSYGCPWCSFINPLIEQWKAKTPVYINFSRIPLTFEKGWDNYAKAYYFAVTQNIENKITPALFLAIHGKHDQEMNDLSSSADLINFFVEHGVKRATAEAAFENTSANMNEQLKSGLVMMKIYKVFAIPTFVVGEKYSVNLKQAKNAKRFIAIVNYLIEQAHET